MKNINFCNDILQGNSVVNLAIKKNESKVVDNVDIEEIGDKKVFCRCWRSAMVHFIIQPILLPCINFYLTFQFPYCDGTHNKHNAATGDNVGPLIIGKKSA